MIKQPFYLKGIVRNQGKGRAGLGVELYRLDSKKTDDEEDEDIELDDNTDEEDEEDKKKDAYDKSQIAIMRVYENIGEDFFTGQGITATGFAEELDKLGEIKRLKLHINCLGGDTHTAQAIFNILADHPSRKTTYIDGIAASAATIVACAGHEVVARRNTNYMIHNPWTVAIGNSGDLREAADVLDKITDPIVSVYKHQVKGKIDEAKIRNLMDAETWMTAEEAEEYGFVDKVRGRVKAVASLGNGRICSAGKIFNLGKYQYRNVPKYPKIKIEPKASATVPVAFKNKEKKEPNMNIEEIRAEHPDLYASIQQEARVAERIRLSALDAMMSPGLEALIAAAKSDGREPKDIAVEACNIMKVNAAQQAQANAVQKDAAAANTVVAGDAPTVKIGNDEKSKKDKVVSLLTNAHANLAARRQRLQVPNRN